MASTTTPSKKSLSSSASSVIGGGPAGSGRISPTATRTPTTVHKSRGSIHTSNGTPISARASVRKPTPSSSATSLSAALDPEPAQAKMDELRERLETAESSAADLRRQNDFLQAKLDDAGKEQAKTEEKMHEDEERIEELENQKRELLKQKRELEQIFEAERVQEMKTKEQSSHREEEMQSVIQRLKESLSQKQHQSDSASRSGEEFSLSRNNSFTASSSPTLDATHFAPSGLQRSNSFRNNSNSKLLLQKDKLIEELRLELAELQIKLMELENKGGGRLQDLEKALVEARMTNARLMEENESFQSLLMERTLNGDFSKNGAHSGSPGNKSRVPSSSGATGASLADELASIAESDGNEDGGEKYRRLEVELERQKAENKALTLYINKIIERILKHQGGFETILSNQDDEPAVPSTPSNKNKALPPSPPGDTTAGSDQDGGQGQSLLQRAKSLALRGRPIPTRPTSQFIGSTSINQQPSVVEDPSTAPSIPLGRSQSQKRHSMAPMLPRRVQTSGEFPNNLGAAAVIGNMTRGGAESDVGSPKPTTYFNLMSRLPSGTRTTAPTSTPTPGTDTESRPRTRDDSLSIDDSDSDAVAGNARQAALDALTGGPSTSSEAGSTPSPPRSLKDDREARIREQSVLSGNKPRPLRLLNDEQKKNNRNSWMPTAVGNLGSWFNPGAQASAGQPQTQPQPPQQ